jgi:hypothetical protein
VTTQKILGPLDLTRKPAGHWTIDGSKNIRNFLDDLARSWHKDPLDPETWYTFNLEELTKAKVCVASVVGVDVSVGVGMDVRVCDLCVEKGGLPLDPETWYTFNVKELTKVK